MTKLHRGKLFAGYRIIERLGTTVFLVEDDDGRSAALRVLDDPPAELLASCFNAACMASQVNHPAIAKTYDVGVVDDRAFIVTEHIEGDSLARRLARRGSLPLSDSLRLAQRIAQALAALHDKGLAHGALEPSSIVLGDDKLALIGFGLAALGGGDPMACIEALPPPIYTAPEQCRTAACYDAPSDLYALGCILFEMLTGHPPFRSSCWGELITSHLMAPPPALPASTPRPIRDLVASLLAKNPVERPTADLVIHTIAGALDDLELSAIPRAPWRWIAAFAISLFFVIPTAYAQADRKVQDLFHTVDLPSLPL